MKKGDGGNMEFVNHGQSKEYTFYETLMWNILHRPLTDIEYRRLKNHVAVCGLCGRLYEDYKEIAAPLAAEMEGEDPSPEFMKSLGERCADTLEKKQGKVKSVRLIREYSLFASTIGGIVAIMVFLEFSPKTVAGNAAPIPTAVKTFGIFPISRHSEVTRIRSGDGVRLRGVLR
jgi:hypothetical protein